MFYCCLSVMWQRKKKKFNLLNLRSNVKCVCEIRKTTLNPHLPRNHKFHPISFPGKTST